MQFPQITQELMKWGIIAEWDATPNRHCVQFVHMHFNNCMCLQEVTGAATRSLRYISKSLGLFAHIAILLIRFKCPLLCMFMVLKVKENGLRTTANVVWKHILLSMR